MTTSDAPLWEFERRHKIGPPERARLDVDESGQLVLSVLDDHDEWAEVTLDREAAYVLQCRIEDYIEDSRTRR